MKTKELTLLITGVILAFSSCVYAQDDSFHEMLKGKTTFDEITETFQQYVQTAPESEEKEKLMKHFYRWAWYTSIHLGPDGEFVNVSKKTLDAVSKLPPPTPGMSANGDWNFQGPHSTYLNNPLAAGLGNGRADRIAFDPINSSIIYVGTPAGGLWKTTNGGTTWSAISSYIPSLGISGIVVSFNDANTIYVLTGDGDSNSPLGLVNLSGFLRLSAGVLVSHDGGENWQMTGELSPNDFVGFRLIQHPINANILLAATSDGIYRTTDGGVNWTQVYSDLIYDIEFKPGEPSRVYATGSEYFLRSADAGASWEAVFYVYQNARSEIAVTPASPNNVYFLSGPAIGGNRFVGFSVSTNSGETFTEICDSPNVFGDENGVGDQSEYDIGLAVKPTDASKIIIGGLIIYKSTDGGYTFTPATTYWESGGNYIHPDVHAVAYNPLNNYLYAATDGGFYRSLSDGNVWTNLYTGLNTAQIYHFDDCNSYPYTVLAGLQDNGVKFRSSNTTQFSHISSGDGFDCVINPQDQYEGFVSINKFIRYYSHFTLDTPQVIFNSPNYWFSLLELNVSDPNILYYSNRYIYKYVLNSGSVQLSTNSGWWALKTCPSNSLKIYAAGGYELFSNYGDMYRTDNGGTSWVTVSSNSGFPAEYPRITDIGVRPNNSSNVYVCFSGYTDGLKVLYSGNSGSNWGNRTYDLPNVPVWSIEVDGSGGVYIGTDIGVYYKATNATVWEPFYNNLPNVPISDLAINEGSNQLMAATFGRGIWKSTLRDPCMTSYGITSNVSGQYFRSASSSIGMNAQVIGGEGTDVVLRAGDYIDLSSGFRADGDAGNKFRAYNGPCDSGIPADFNGDIPVYPDELLKYDLNFSRHSGTLEVPVSESPQKQVVLRLFQDGNVRIITADSKGNFIREIANFEGKKDTYTYDIVTSGLEPGLYFLYLVIDNEVDHLQEMEVYSLE